MKKTIYSLMLLAGAVLLAASCSDAEDFVPNKENGSVIFVAGNPEMDTRTELGVDNGVMVPMWSAGDKIHIHWLLSAAGELYDNYDYAVCTRFDDVAENAQKAVRTAKFKPDDAGKAKIDKWKENGNEMVAIYYPSDNFGTRTFSDSREQITQTVTRNNFDKNEDILVSEPFTIPKTGNVDMIKLKFKRISALLRFNFIDKTVAQSYAKEVKTVKVNMRLPSFFGFNFSTATERPDVVREYRYKNIYAESSEHFYTVRGKDNATDFSESVYLCTAPGDLLGTMDVTLTFNDGSTVLKSIDIPKTINGAPVPLPSGKITTFNITFTDTQTSVTIDGFGEYENL